MMNQWNKKIYKQDTIFFSPSGNADQTDLVRFLNILTQIH